MAPFESGTKSTPSRHSLRVVGLASATVGLFLNIITISTTSNSFYTRGPEILTGCAFIPLVLSIAWDFSDIALKPSLEKHIEKVHDEISPEIAKAFIAFVDFLGFLGFLALLVTNGIMIRDLGKGYYHYYGPPNDKIMALTYNSVPWIICAACHLLIFLFIIGGFLPADKFPKIKIEWPEAANAWDGLTGHANDGADAPLLHNEDTGEHDEEA